MDITKSKIIVTGAASGLGAACAGFLSQSGAQVSGFDISDAVEASADALNFFAQRADVTDENSLKMAVDRAAAHMGGVNVVVNCAGIVIAEKTLGRNGPHGLDGFKRTLDINLAGSFNLARLGAEIMAENDPNDDGERGVIVNTASVAAFEGQKGQAAYAASKAGIAGLSLPMARDLASQGIRVMAIAPGIFRTPMLEGLGEDVMQGLAKDVTFPKRLGKPQEFAQMVRVIIENAYLNGSTIRLDGGLRMP